MDNQKVVYVVIKESDNILLIKNEHWHDYSFVGGKCEDQDEDIPEITAYRETQEELGLIGGAHFVLDQIGDHSFSVKKYSARTGTVRDYRFYLFLFSARRDSVRRKVERDNTVWVKISEIHEFEYDGFPVAETVQQVFKNIDLSTSIHSAATNKTTNSGMLMRCSKR
jgi:8-oxo-dGTP pyrophosphatase MutT (NUDIX family)